MKFLSVSNSASDRVEIRLTGLDKGKDGDLNLAMRNAGRGRKLDELSTLTPPAGSDMTIAAARWAARQQESHPERVAYKDGAIIIEARRKDYIGNESAEWEALIAILNEVTLEVARERPPRPGPFQKIPTQSPKEVAIRRRLATYVQN